MGRLDGRTHLTKSQISYNCASFTFLHRQTVAGTFLIIELSHAYTNLWDKYPQSLVMRAIVEVQNHILDKGWISSAAGF